MISNLHFYFIKMTKSTVAYFSSPGFTSTTVENQDGSITKRGLILVEGSHTDSKKRDHVFDRQRVMEIVNNTNAAFQNGMRIPMFKEHNKHIDSMIGEVESPFEARIITAEDLTKNSPRHFIGKLGVFANDLVIKARDTIEKVKDGIARELSPGIDVVKNMLMEVSVVAQPAIQGMSMYAMANAEEANENLALTLDDYRNQEDMEDDQVEEMWEELTETFYKVVKNIKNAGDEELQGADPYDLLNQAFGQFMDETQELLTSDIYDQADSEDDPNSYDSVDLSPAYTLRGQMGQMSTVTMPMTMPVNDLTTLSPYSLYSQDNANFAFGWNSGRGLLNTIGKGTRQAFGGKIPRTEGGTGINAARKTFGDYFTKPIKGVKGARRLGLRRIAGATALGAGTLWGASKVASALNPFGHNNR